MPSELSQQNLTSDPSAPVQAQGLFGNRGHDKLHFVTQGEKRFDTLTYRTVGYWVNVLLSMGAVLAVERTEGGQKFLNGIVARAKKLFPKAKPETVETIATKTFFLSGGFAVLAPMKWLEDAKLRLIKKWDREIYGDKVDTDPKIQQAHAELEAAPKQTWLSVIGSRFLALVPFYLTIGALWTRESTLAKWTNPELRKMSKEAITEMKATDPAKFSQVTSKGLYIDKLIDSVARGMGKGWARITGNATALGQIERMEHEFPGTVRSAITKNGSHDPIHSTMPYYVISETITSAMVAWGVFALTRVLGPIIGKKQAAPEAKVGAPQVGIAEKQTLAGEEQGSFEKRTVQAARAHGVTISHFHAPESAEGGYFDAKDKVVYINTARPKERQQAVLVHECQHARNVLEGKVLDKRAALADGEAAYTENFLRDEALAHAAGFIHAHETASHAELHSPAMQSLFKNMAYTGADDQALERYADHAMAPLRQGALGYTEKAKESFAAQHQEAAKHAEKPHTKVQQVQHERTQVSQEMVQHV